MLGMTASPTSSVNNGAVNLVNFNPIYSSPPQGSLGKSFALYPCDFQQAFQSNENNILVRMRIIEYASVASGTRRNFAQGDQSLRRSP